MVFHFSAHVVEFGLRRTEGFHPIIDLVDLRRVKIVVWRKMFKTKCFFSDGWCGARQPTGNIRNSGIWRHRMALG